MARPMATRSTARRALASLGAIAWFKRYNELPAANNPSGPTTIAEGRADWTRRTGATSAARAFAFKLVTR